MTAKEYLSQAWKIECEIRVRQSEIEAIRASLHGRSQKSGGIGSQPADNSIEKAICKVIDRERELDQEIGRLVAMKSEIACLIDRVPDARLRELLVRRYLSFEKWDHIAAQMHTDIRWIFRLHDRALGVVGRLMKTDH